MTWIRQKIKIQHKFKKTKSYIRTNNTESKEFVTREDMRQGGVLNLTTFNVILDEAAKEVKDIANKLREAIES